MCNNSLAITKGANNILKIKDVIFNYIKIKQFSLRMCFYFLSFPLNKNLPHGYSTHDLHETGFWSIKSQRLNNVKDLGDENDMMHSCQ